MPWCPKCKNEYYEGIKVCADCKTELVDSLEEWEKTQNEAREEALKEELAAYTEMLSEEELCEENAEGEEDSPRMEEAEGFGKISAKKARRDAREVSRGVYRNYEEKAADNKSSAYTLLGVGAVGVLVILLHFLGIIRLPLYGSSKFIVLGVIGAMFLFFIVMGVVSMKNAGKYAKKAESEKELTKELEKWFVEYVTAEKIDDGLFSEEEAEFSEE